MELYNFLNFTSTEHATIENNKNISLHNITNVTESSIQDLDFRSNPHSTFSYLRNLTDLLVSGISTTTTTEYPTTYSTFSTFNPFIYESSSIIPNVSTTTENSSLFKENEIHDSMMPMVELVPTIIFLSIICLGIILGNLLVIVAVFTQKSLRSPQNIYIVSLALADMTVGVIILPFNIAHIIMGKWIFGEIFCKMYLTTDVSLCCGSIFHLCLIGIDRYRAITEGITYVQERNLKSVLWSIGILWILAIWIASPPLLSVNNWSIKYDGGICELPSSSGYAFHLFIGGLFFPLIIMSAIYWKIYKSIQARLRERATITCLELTSDADSTDNKLDESTDNTLDEASLTTTSGNNFAKTTNSQNKKPNAKRKQSEQVRTFLTNKQKFSLSRERKAAKTLGIIMGAFIICWLPLGFLNIIGSLCPDNMKPSLLIFHIFTWLGYVNSGLNPIIYGMSNQEFKKAYKRVLHLK